MNFTEKNLISDDITESKFKSILSIGEEVINTEELNLLLKNKSNIVAYDGFEPSGRMHLAQGLLRAHNVNKFTDAGIKFKFWVADWFALMNLKLGGDLKKIQNAGKLMIETWKACGMNLDNVEFIWSSEEINKRSDEYWKIVLDIATKFNLSRIKKCTQIMGRDESDDLAASQIFYPVMQAADVFFLDVDICSLGMDQRKVNMLCREYSKKSKRKFPPVIVSHHMVMGLDGSDKMSKSSPDNAIFMDDSEQDVKRKIKKAFCKPAEVEGNPLLDWTKWILFPILGKVVIPGNDKWKIPEKIYDNYEDLEKDYIKEEIHPNDLKLSMVYHINKLMEPVRKHFEENNEAKNLLKLVKSYK
jgi:tyrosyl-tRNA synthetase